MRGSTVNAVNRQSKSSIITAMSRTLNVKGGRGREQSTPSLSPSLLFLHIISSSPLPSSLRRCHPRLISVCHLFLLEDTNAACFWPSSGGTAPRVCAFICKWRATHRLISVITQKKKQINLSVCSRVTSASTHSVTRYLCALKYKK